MLMSLLYGVPPAYNPIAPIAAEEQNFFGKLRLDYLKDPELLKEEQ